MSSSRLLDKSDLVPAEVTVFDLKGSPVRRMELAGKKAGEEISWDGKDQDGNQLPPGKYTFRVHGVDQNGQAREIATEHSGRVTGVEMEGEIPTLLVQTPGGQQRIEMPKVKQVTVGSDSPAQASTSMTPAAPVVMAPPTRLAMTSEGEQSEQSAPSARTAVPVEFDRSPDHGSTPDLSSVMGSFSR